MHSRIAEEFWDMLGNPSQSPTPDEMTTTIIFNNHLFVLHVGIHSNELIAKLIDQEKGFDFVQCFLVCTKVQGCF